MYSPVFELESFNRAPVDLRKSMIQAAVEFLIAINRLYIRRFGAPAMYQAGLQYRFKVRPFGLDAWQDIPRCITLGTGDCKDFSAWRVAELRESGATDANPRVIASESGGLVVYHVQVIRDTPNGPIVEDPSRIFGMPPSISAEAAQKLMVGPSGGGVDGVADALRGGQMGQMGQARALPSPARARGGVIPWLRQTRAF